MCRASRCILGHWGLERHAEAAPPGIDLVGHLARQEELRLDLDGRSVAGLKADLRRKKSARTGARRGCVAMGRKERRVPANQLT